MGDFFSHKSAIWNPSSHCSQKLNFDKIQNRLKQYNLGSAFIPKKVEKYHSKPQKIPNQHLCYNSLSQIKSLKLIASKKHIKHLFLTRGGYGCLNLLSTIDQSIKFKNSKLLTWGYSDSTTLQLYFYNKYNWPYIQGPHLNSEAFLSPNRAERKNLKNLIESDGNYSFDLKKITAMKNPKKVILIGGNLSCIISMLGTPFEAKAPTKPYLLVLEDVNESTAKLDKMLCQLNLSRLVSNPRFKGFVTGHFTNCPRSQQLLIQYSKSKKYLLYTGLKLGHESPNLYLPMGTTYNLDLISKNKTQFTLTTKRKKDLFR